MKKAPAKAPMKKPKPTDAKPINIHNFDAALWERFRNYVTRKKGTVAGHLEDAVRAKLEREGF